MKLTGERAEILRAMSSGCSLRIHRTIDGVKVHRLHALDGSQRDVDGKSVRSLAALGMIQSNQKFPVATYLLTEAGLAQAGASEEPGSLPLIATGTPRCDRR
jgi:hypothetical protein